jgi:hypothetical protein
MKTVVVHRFRLSDVDEPDLYASAAIDKWMQTDAGRWVSEHKADEIVLQSGFDYNYFGHKFIVTTKLKDEDATFFLLKYH